MSPPSTWRRRPARRTRRPPGSVTYSRADVTDFGQAMAALSMIDERVAKVTGVVHLAAIPAPGRRPTTSSSASTRVSTYNVFEAARQLGIKNVVWASSETVYGIPYPKGPPYVPVDEEIHAAGDRLFAVEADRRGDGEAVLPLGPGAEDHRPPLLQRHGAARTTRASRASTPIRARATSISGPISTRATPRRRSGSRSRRESRARRSSASPTPTR